MVAFLDRFLALVERLNAHGVEYVIVGGVAMNLHGLTRATQNVDVFLKPTRSNIERFKVALFEMWQDPDIDEILTDELLGDYPVVRYGPPEHAFYVDIITRLGELFEVDSIV